MAETSDNYELIPEASWPRPLLTEHLYVEGGREESCETSVPMVTACGRLKEILINSQADSLNRLDKGVSLERRVQRKSGYRELGEGSFPFCHFSLSCR